MGSPQGTLAYRESLSKGLPHPSLPLFLKAQPTLVLPARLGQDQAPGSSSRAAAAASAEPRPSVSCEPEQETSPELTSPSGGNNPEHLEDPNVWKTSLSSSKCAGHSTQLGPREIPRLGWERRGGVLGWVFAHRKRTLPAFVVFLQGRALLRSRPLAPKATEEKQLPTLNFSETLVTPSLTQHTSLWGSSSCVKG